MNNAGWSLVNKKRSSVNFYQNDENGNLIIDPENSASIKVFKNNNFVYEGLLKDDAYARNKYFDMAIHSLIEKKSRS